MSCTCNRFVRVLGKAPFEARTFPKRSLSKQHLRKCRRLEVFNEGSPPSRRSFCSPTSTFQSRHDGRHSGIMMAPARSDDGIKHERGIPETIFSMYKNPANDLLNLGNLIAVIENTGIRRTDPRLNAFMDNVGKYHKQHGQAGTTFENLDVDFGTFSKLVEDNIIIMSQTFRNDLVIPDFSEFCDHIKDIYMKCKSNRTGNVASYIPQLSRYSPDYWALSVCTVDGQRFSLGDVNVPFTMQSCSKPFTYAICMNELGQELVHQYIGHEPSGKNFNEICLDSKSRPHNPMLNSGAIMSCALIMNVLQPDLKIAEKFDYLLNYLRRIAGDEHIGFNNSVFLSERESADRNFAMAYFMKENKCFPKGTNIMQAMDLYFQTCSMEVTTEALSLMGATLANGGICPTTGDKVIKPECVRDVLSLMHSCGMYNYSGEFAFKVGLPAKSGVSGALVIVVPNTMSIAVWSPPLDPIGNSARGLQFCQELVELFNFHRFDNLRHSEKKLDPRKTTYEVKGLSIITLLFAATVGDVSALKRHYLQGIDMNQGDYDERTALHLAAANGQRECTRFLLHMCNVEPEPKDRWGFTPLEEAKRFGFHDTAKIIEEYIENNNNIDLTNCD